MPLTAAMARLSRRLAQNVGGEFYVDSSCIDCETCYIVAPGSFAESEAEQSHVFRQPASAEERRRAWMALVACPTASIGICGRRGDPEARAAALAFPEPILPGVFYCGYAAEASFGASSYLVHRPGTGPDAGNVLVDSPRAAGPLLQRIEELGGVRWMLLTHQDDVADHAAFHARFGCERVLHEADLGHATARVELRLAGREPTALAGDLLVIPVPGHTRGSVALLHREVLFTGDHLWGDPSGALAAGRSVCWHSWSEQLRSLERLLEFPFRTVLPGHGRPWFGASAAAAHEELRRLLERLRA